MSFRFSVQVLQFNLVGGQEIRSVIIANNSFNKCECGIYFNNSGAAATYSDINITTNTFVRSKCDS